MTTYFSTSEKPFQKGFRSLVKLSALFFILLISACEYQPDEIPETFVEQPGDDAPVIFIQVQPEMDTLRLCNLALAKFNFDDSEKTPDWIQIYFDQELVLDQEYKKTQFPEFLIEAPNYSPGMHEFTIRAFIRTNTGSIADKLGAENYLYEAKWPVYIQHGAEVKIESVVFSNGSARVQWSKYNFWDFIAYSFSKKSTIEGNEYFAPMFTNPYFTSYVDVFYTEGEIAQYCIGLNGYLQRCYEFSVPIKPPQIKLNQNNEIEISWEKSANQNNWESYFISSKYELNGFVEKQRIYTADSTATVFKKIGFGKPFEFQVRYIPKTFTGEYLNFQSAGGITIFNLGNPMPAYEKIYALGESEKLLLYKNVNYKDRFYRYNKTIETVEDSVQIEGFVTDKEKMMVSPNGEYFAYFTHEKFVLRKTSDFSIVSQQNFPFLNFGNLNIFNAQLSNDLRLFLVDHYYTFKMINAVNGEEILRKTSAGGNSIYQVKVNNNGDKIIFHQSELGKSTFSLFKIENNELVWLGNSAEGKTFSDAQIHFINNKIVLLYKEGFWNYKIDIRNTNDFTIEKTVSIPEKYRPEIFQTNQLKVISNYVHSGYSGYSFLTDLESSTSQKIYPVLGWGPFLLKNNILYGSNGQYIHTNQLLINE